MRVLCVYELGSATESLDHLHQCVKAMRKRYTDLEVHLALKSDHGEADLSWADKVYSTPGMRVKSEHDAHGYWRHFHNSGWTDPRLRKAVITVWANIFKTIKPDYVLAAGSPGALLVASFENIKGINVGNGQFVPSVAGWPETCPFPEMEAWLFVVTQLTAQQLMTHPSIIFTPRIVDEVHTGPALNVFDNVIRADGISMDVDVLAIWDIRHKLSNDLLEFGQRTWGERFRLISAEQFRVMGYQPASFRKSMPLLIGNYDPLSIGVAIQHDLGYIGSPLTRQQLAIAERCENQRISYRLDDHLRMLVSHAEDPFILQGHGLSRTEHKIKSSADIDHVLSLLMRP
jgi:hypothetical protein